jgi:hypothetical protein
MKTKERCGKLGNKAGMSMKIKEIVVKSGNYVENEGLNTMGGEHEMIERPSATTRESPQMALPSLVPNLGVSLGAPCHRDRNNSKIEGTKLECL